MLAPNVLLSSRRFVLNCCVDSSYELLEKEIHKDPEAADQHCQDLAKVVVHIFCYCVLLLALQREGGDDFFCERREGGGFTIAD